jgi:hypothetical protein
MTTVRIAHAEPRPGNLGNGIFLTGGYLVVLVDDEGHRALAAFLRGHPGGGSLNELLNRADDDIVIGDAAEELNARLLGAAGTRVTGVDIDVAASGDGELDLDASTARIELSGPAGAGHVPAPFGLGLALAVAAGAPVRVPGPVLDRLAVPVTGDDLLGPFLGLVPPQARLAGGRLGGMPLRLPSRRPRYEPRNMTFADGLDWWDLDGRFGEDYSCATEGRSASLAAAVPEPRGSAALVQAVFPDDYRGATIAFRGEISTARLSYEAGLRLEIVRDRRQVRDDHTVIVPGGSDWTAYEVTARVPGDADLIRFGLTLGGPGRVALRNPDLRRPEPARA